MIAEFLLEGAISFVWTLTVSSGFVRNVSGSDALLFLQNVDSELTGASSSAGDSKSVNSTARPISKHFFFALPKFLNYFLMNNLERLKVSRKVDEKKFHFSRLEASEQSYLNSITRVRQYKVEALLTTERGHILLQRKHTLNENITIKSLS